MKKLTLTILILFVFNIGYGQSSKTYIELITQMEMNNLYPRRMVCSPIQETDSLEQIIYKYGLKKKTIRQLKKANSSSVMRVTLDSTDIDPYWSKYAGITEVRVKKYQMELEIYNSFLDSLRLEKGYSSIDPLIEKKNGVSVADSFILATGLDLSDESLIYITNAFLVNNRLILIYKKAHTYREEKIDNHCVDVYKIRSNRRKRKLKLKDGGCRGTRI